MFASASSRVDRRVHGPEWPTWCLIVAVYGVWWLSAAAAGRHGAVWGTVPLVFATCWFMSLQHELLHGHPTRHAGINRLFGLAPLAVWFPYDLYRSAHLAHHRDETLTHPGVDPESNYLPAADYERLPAWCRPLAVAQRTVVGRLLLGPAMVIVPAVVDALRRPGRLDRRHVVCWLEHLTLLALLLWGLDHWAGIAPWRYLSTVAYPALGLSMLRSFYEHRPADLPAHRIAINEAGWFWRLLFLNNNYHAVHHDAPGLPWYLVRRRYLADRQGLLERNGHFLLDGYWSLLARYAVTPVDAPVHPSVDR